MNTWLKMLAMEIQEVPEKMFAHKPVSPDDTVVGTLPDELINLYSLWTATAKESELVLIDLRYSPDDEALQSRYDELLDKSRALEALFWIGVKEHFRLWGTGLKATIGIRQDYQIVKLKRTDNMPPFLRGLFGG